MPTAQLQAKVKVLSLDRQKFLTILRLVNQIDFSGAKLLKVANFLLIEIREGKLYITASDMTSTVKDCYGEVDFDEMKFIFPTDILYHIVSTSTTDQIKIKRDPKGNFTINANGTYKIQAITEEFVFPDLDTKCDIFHTFEEGEIRHCWSKVSVGTSQDVTKPIYSAICFDGNFCATDGRYAAAYLYGDKKFDPVLLHKSVGALISSLEGKVDVGLSPEKHVIFRSQKTGSIVITRQILGVFPDYRKLFEKFNFTDFFSVSKDELGKSLDRLSIFTNVETGALNFKVDKAKNVLTLIGTNNNEGSEVLPLLEYQGPDEFSAILNVGRVRDSLSSLDGDKCKMMFKGENPITVLDNKIWIVITQLAQR